MRGGSHFRLCPEQGLAPGWGGSQARRCGNTALGPAVPSECREELVEGMPKNLELNREGFLPPACNSQDAPGPFPGMC